MVWGTHVSLFFWVVSLTSSPDPFSFCYLQIFHIFEVPFSAQWDPKIWQNSDKVPTRGNKGSHNCPKVLKIAKSRPEASEIIQKRPQCEPKVIKIEHGLAQHIKTKNGGRSALPVGTFLVLDLGWVLSITYIAQNSKQKMRAFPPARWDFLGVGI